MKAYRIVEPPLGDGAVFDVRNKGIAPEASELTTEPDARHVYVEPAIDKLRITPNASLCTVQ